MEIRHDTINDLLRDEDMDKVNALLADGSAPCFSNTDLGGLNLSGFDIQSKQALDFSNSRLCRSDLRGLDLSHCNLQGASLKEAKVSGVLFPAAIPAQEIAMSLQHGTRIRY